VEHGVDEERDHGCDFRSEQGLRSHSAGSEVGIGVDDVRVGGNVKEDHGEAEDGAGDAWRDPMDPWVCSREREEEQRDRQKARNISYPAASTC